MQHMRNLTLASAKHLMQAGHITERQHASIVNKVSGRAASREMDGMERQAKHKRKAPSGFGSLVPQQAQAPIPGTPPGADTPDGTASGY